MNRCFVLWLIFSLVAENVLADHIRVSTVDELRAAVARARPGDVIVVANGVYEMNEDIVINTPGLKSQPVIISAEMTGQAEMSGDGGFRIEPPARYIIIRGFRFTHAASRARSESGTSFCRWTRNIFENPGRGDYLTINGSDHEIDSNTFQNKNSLGKFIAVRGEGNQIAQRLWIHHNYFNNFLNQGGANGAEALQFGLSGFSLSSSNSVVEYNLFEKCHGENELISVKASEVTLRYNTIRDCPAQFTLRHGNRCEVYGNYFINTPGLRIFGDDHVIHSNYFENCSMGINIGNGGGEVADGDKLTSHDRPDRVLIAFNTLVNNRRSIVQTHRKNGLGATSITFAYNIVIGGERAAEISGPLKDPVWKNNIVVETHPGDLPSGAFQTVDPRLTRDGAASYHLRPDSGLRDYARGNFPRITVDMDGQPRSDQRLDAGADEHSDAPVQARMLSSDDVGHDARH